MWHGILIAVGLALFVWMLRGLLRELKRYNSLMGTRESDEDADT